MCTANCRCHNRDSLLIVIFSFWSRALLSASSAFVTSCNSWQNGEPLRDDGVDNNLNFTADTLGTLIHITKISDEIVLGVSISFYMSYCPSVISLCYHSADLFSTDFKTIWCKRCLTFRLHISYMRSIFRSFRLIIMMANIARGVQSAMLLLLNKVLLYKPILFHVDVVVNDLPFTVPVALSSLQHNIYQWTFEWPVSTCPFPW